MYRKKGDINKNNNYVKNNHIIFFFFCFLTVSMNNHILCNLYFFCMNQYCVNNVLIFCYIYFYCLKRCI